MCVPDCGYKYKIVGTHCIIPTIPIIYIIVARESAANRPSYPSGLEAARRAPRHKRPGAA